MGDGDKPMTLLIARAAGGVTFQSVIEPFRGAPTITNVKRLEVRPALPHLAAANEMGIGLEVDKPDGRHTFMLGYTWWGLKTYGDFQFDGHIAFVSRKSGAGGAVEPQPGYVYMVDGSQLSAAGFAIHTGKLTDAPTGNTLAMYETAGGIP
jgi:hypothetical protein